MNDSIDFQIVTENLATVLEPKPRVLDNLIPTWNIIIVMLAMLILVLNKQLFAQRFKMFSLTTKPADVDKLTREWNPIASLGGMSVAIIYIALISLLVQKIVMVFSDNHILYSGISFYLEIKELIKIL